MDVQAVAAATSSPEPAPLPAAPVGNAAGDPQSQPHADPGVLSPIVAKLMSSGGTAQSVSVNVSYRVEHNPDIIVTVFTDPNTGAEIAQVPAEVLVQLAQFFDQHSGVTLDRSV